MSDVDSWCMVVARAILSHLTLLCAWCDKLFAMTIIIGFCDPSISQVLHAGSVFSTVMSLSWEDIMILVKVHVCLSKSTNVGDVCTNKDWTGEPRDSKWDLYAEQRAISIAFCAKVILLPMQDVSPQLH